MDNKHGFTISNRDRVLRAWENSMELVRDFQYYSHEIGNDEREIAQLFAEFAEDEANHASTLLEHLRNYESSGKN